MTNNISRYNEIREIGMDLNTNLFKTINGDEIRIVARALGLLRGKKLILHSDAEMDRFTDFAINDYINQDGKNFVVRYLEENFENLTKDEKIILDSLSAAKPSLYEIVEIDENKSSIKLVDIINKGTEFTITDIGFSQSPMVIGFLLYTRIICIDDICMTSGAPMLFEGFYKSDLVEKSSLYAKKSLVGNETTKRSAAFFKLYKKIGFQNVEYR